MPVEMPGAQVCALCPHMGGCLHRRGLPMAPQVRATLFRESPCNRGGQGASFRVMNKYIAGFTMAVLLILPAFGQDKPPLKLKVGDTAPDFNLKYYDGAKVQDISLKEFRGKKNVLLAFFVFAFTGG